MKIPNKIVYFKEWICDAVIEKYTNNDSPALVLIDHKNGSPIATCSINIDPIPEKGYIYIKDHGENVGIVDALIKADIIESDTSLVPLSQFVNATLCKFKIEDYEYKPTT